jgi:hypothetical protein
MAVERHAERKDFAGADQCCRPDDVLGHHVIERADPVVLAPAVRSFSVASVIAFLPR